MLRGRVRDKLDDFQKLSEETAVSSDIPRVDAETEEKLLEKARQDLKCCMEQKRFAVGGAMNRAEYDKDARTVTVTKFAGKLIKNMGRNVTGKRLLYPEEALFLMEAAALELSHNRVPLSLSQAYSLLLSSTDLSWNQYALYCHLTRAGYTVVRRVDPPSEETVSAERSTRRLSVIYDVHLADSEYTMSKKQKPDHRLLVMGADDVALSVDELIALRTQLSDDVPLHVGVVDAGDVIYFGVNWVVTPNICHDI